MADMDNPHFDKVFWYIIFITSVGLAYAGYASFFWFPPQNKDIVNFVLGFMLGTLVTAGVGYLLGGNPVVTKKPIVPENTEVTSTTTSTTVSKPKPVPDPVLKADNIEVTGDKVNVQEK